MKTLYLSDLDGTLLRSDQRISEFTAREINRMVDEGMLFSYATARSVITARKATKGLNARIPLILYNGAFIMDSVTNEVMLSNFFGPEEADELVPELTAARVYPIVYSVSENRERFSFLSGRVNEPTRAFIESRKDDPRKTAVDRAEDLIKGDAFYVTCIGEAEKLAPFYEKYREKHRCIFHQDVYSGEMWLEIMPKGASKANAARQLAEYLGCGRLVAFGDAKNDLDLFEAADECYAVKNAVPELKKAATGVIGSNEEDGVAKWLKAEWDGRRTE